MHSYTGPSGRTYHHESHGSLDDVVHFNVTTRNPEVHIPTRDRADDTVDVEVTITMRDVLFLAAGLLRSRSISALEEATPEELLGLPDPDVSHVTGRPVESRSQTLGAPIPPGGPNLSGWFTNPRD